MPSDEIDLREYLTVLFKWKWVIALLTGVAVLTSAIFSFFILPPVYETKVTLLVTNAAQNQQSLRPGTESSVVETVSRIPVMTLNTYMNQITSPYFLKRVIDELRLQIAPAALANAVTTQVLKDTNLIEVRVQNEDPELAMEIANTIATEFVAFVSETNQERMSKSLAFLREQKQALEKELQEAYARLKAIQSRKDNVVSLSRDISTKTEVIARLREDLARAQVERNLLEAGLKKIQEDLAQTPENIPGPVGPDGTATFVSNPRRQELLQLKTDKEISLAEKNAEISGLMQQIAETEASLSAMEAKLTVVQNEESEATSNVKRLEDTLSLLDAKMVEAQMAQSINFGEATISVISPALVPDKPIKPRKTLNMAVAAVLGLFSSVLVTFVLEYLDNTIKTQDDVEKYLSLGTLGVIPLVTEAEKSESSTK